MMYTGSLIADLISAVERVEAAQPEEPCVADPLAADAWSATDLENTNYDAKLFLWQESGVA